MNEAVFRARLPEEDRDERSDALDAWDDEDGDHDPFALAKSLARVHLDVSHVLHRNNSSSNSNNGVHSIYGQVKPPRQDAIVTVPGSHLLKRSNKAKGEVEEEEEDEEENDDLDEDEDEDDDCVDSGLGEDDLDVDDGDDYEDEDGDDQEELDEEQAKYERYSGNNLAEAEATACSTSGSSTSEDQEIPNPMQALQSPFGLEATVWFEYPAWLGIQRPQSADHITLQLVSKDAQKRDPSAFRWRSYWERKCLKDVFQAAGMQGGRGEKRRSAVVWTKHAKKWKALRSSQRHNHFAGSWTIGRKDRLAFTINRKKRENGTNAFGFLPETYILPLHAARLRQVLSAPQARRQTWIRKPLASSQGRGIRVLSHQAALEVVKTCGKRKSASSKKASSSRGCVVQRYIDRPLLINRFKFDIRLYVLVTGYDPLRVYLFPEGLVRFCTQPYSNSVASKKNQFRHLTNYSINKKSERFEHNQSAENDAVGSKWSLSAWYRYMEATFGEAATQKVRDDMEAVIVKTLIAADDDINQKMASLVPHSESCFELFGFDLMLDRDLRAWLVEVNISPSLMTASPLDRKVKTMLVCDALHLVGIPAPLESDAEAQAIADRQKVEGHHGLRSLQQTVGSFSA
ncbi:Tubulin polyglutamylase TTLL5 [Hondaea fermentalgiana]|uniref:Tubulin--tyrosine ligase-like protein 5 n=1 Tax=Hondaea fermentalgiana TaxID=2315210 RepID=A0A2R5G5H1_9STRA|nr:Tubulin polyglutamylase TTLL5 [Hondaea fermentalgiana]|eukprot:GBG26287.1 Tubulin polyglutamylase TTLL5 [Hondaea fermentalgiana]